MNSITGKSNIFQQLKDKINCADVLKYFGIQYDGGSIKCPFSGHNDSTPSFGLFNDNRNFKCFGCQAHGDSIELFKQLSGKEQGEFLNEIKKLAGMSDTSEAKKKIISVYDYKNADGSSCFQVVRYEPKDFRQRRNEKEWSLKGVNRVLYRLPELLAAKEAKETVFVCEGEKDADSMVKNGFKATCNSGGAISGVDDRKWETGYTDTLSGCHICIVADKDAPGRKHAAAIAEIMSGKAASLCVIELPDIAEKEVKDAADYFNAGGTADQLKELVRNAPQHENKSIAGHDDGVTVKVDEKVLGDSEDETTEIKARFFEILNDAQNREKSASMADVVLSFLNRRGKLYFNSELKTFDTCMFFDSEKKILSRIGSDEFKSWLSVYCGINTADPKFKYVSAAIETAALSDKHSIGITPERFWAAKDSSIYMSCGDGHLVKITAGRYELLDNGADNVLFESGYTLREWDLVEPKDPFEECSLFKNANFADDKSLDILRLYSLSLPTTPRHKPPLVMSGSVGSGKTRLAVGLSELFGIRPRVSKVLKEGESDFWTAMHEGGLHVFDNADTKTEWLADALAAASTGGQHIKRKLYTDSSNIILNANSWPILTSANPSFASDAGLADRLLVIRMNRRTEDTADESLSKEIEQNRDAGLSFICGTIAMALADQKVIPKNINKRHPDFGDFAVKLGRALGREQQAIEALQAAEKDKSKFNLENDELGQGILLLIESQGNFSGTAADLLGKIKSIDNDFNLDYWKPKRAGKKLAKLWPHICELFEAFTERKSNNTRFTISSRMAFVAFGDPVSPKVPMREKLLDFMENATLNATNATVQASEGARKAIYPEYLKYAAGLFTKEKPIAGCSNGSQKRENSELSPDNVIETSGKDRELNPDGSIPF